LDIPLTAFHGQSDPWLDEAEVAAWAAHTRGRFELVLVPGAHVFRATALDRVCEHIRRAMLA
jgi:surfactin synthase thioesterase subunit